MDSAYLFNLLQKARQVRDFILDKAPKTLEDGAAALGNLQQLLLHAADYIRQAGGSLQFAPGSGHVDSQESQAHLAELKQIHDQITSELAGSDKEIEEFTAARQREADAGVQAGIMDWISKIDPATRKAIGGIFIQILTSVLTKSGIAVASGFLAPKATKHGKSR